MPGAALGEAGMKHRAGRCSALLTIACSFVLGILFTVFLLTAGPTHWTWP